MDKIIRKINLEEYKIRFSGNTESNWGKVANDFELFNKEIISGLTELPLIITESGDTIISAILRYGTMINVLTWLKNFIKSSKIYQICVRKNKLKAILYDEDIELEKYTGETIEFVEEVPYEVTGETGTLLWVNSNYEQFIKYFTNSGDTGETIFYANEFLKFADSNKGETGDTEGYIDIPLFVEEEITDLGQFTSNVDFWVENKRYYLNDIAMDDIGDVYRLVKCDEGNVDYMKVPTILNDFLLSAITLGTKYKLIKNISEVEEDFYDISNKSMEDIKVYISGNSSNFYYVRAYYNGCIDYECDEKMHWQYLENDSETRRTGSGVTAITESKLLSLRRKKKSYDDDSNELPFIYNESSQTVEIQYSADTPMNVINVGDKQYYDYIESINFIPDNENEDSGIVEFKYHIGAYTADTGVIYEEEYPYEIKEYECNYTTKDNNLITSFTYTAIDYTCQIKDIGMELNQDKLYSKIKVDKDTIKSDDFQAVAYFKDENLLGIQKISEDIDINIERGKSAAFERHQVLGEVSSFDDLINYKNGFFTLKSD